MSDASLSAMPRLKAVRRPPPPSALSNALVFGWRAVLKFKHVPEQLFDLVMTPIMFTLLFTYVFGGALAGSPSDYLQFFLPGILVQTVMFNSVYSGMGLSTDLGKGLFDRFRSLPIWPLAPFAGLMVGDILRHLIAGMIIRDGLGVHGSRPSDPHPDDRDDRRLHLPFHAGLRLQHHGRARHHARLAAQLRRRQPGLADGNCHPWPARRPGAPRRRAFGARGPSRADRHFGAGHALALHAEMKNDGRRCRLSPL